MNLRAIGCNVGSAPVELREKLAFDAAKLGRALGELTARYGAEAVVLGTCNRVELYLARPEVGAPVHAPLVAEYLSELHAVPAADIHPHLYEHADADAVRHLFRVSAGLDSVVVGEDQIAGQVKEAFDAAQRAAQEGPIGAVAPPRPAVGGQGRSATAEEAVLVRAVVARPEQGGLAARAERDVDARFLPVLLGAGRGGVSAPHG